MVSLVYALAMVSWAFYLSHSLPSSFICHIGFFIHSFPLHHPQTTWADLQGGQGGGPPWNSLHPIYHIGKTKLRKPIRPFSTPSSLCFFDLSDWARQPPTPWASPSPPYPRVAAPLPSLVTPPSDCPQHATLRWPIFLPWSFQVPASPAAQRLP
jgi:hypothetical protein